MLQTPTLHLQFSERDRKHTEIKRPWGRLGALASLHTSILLPCPLLLAFNLVPLPGTPPPLGTSSGPADPIDLNPKACPPGRPQACRAVSALCCSWPGAQPAEGTGE